jgi:itaconate CoA-transferase
VTTPVNGSVGSGPLAGIIVVAIEQAVAAPMCSRMLADLGARVIKIEHPRGGDFTREYDDVVRGLAAHFVWLNRGKESVALDVKDEAGRAILHRLLVGADVLLSNLGPGATQRLGLDGASLSQRYPRLVTLEISGYGSDGPLAGKRAYDLLVQAESGACAITGRPGQPAKPGPPMADACTGLYAALTIVASLHDRSRTARGVAASVSMFDSMIDLMGYALTHARYTGRDTAPVGLGSPAVAPYAAYQTADGQLVVLGTTNDGEWRRLADLIGRRDLRDDPRYARNPDRVAHRDQLDAVVGAWCAQHTLREVQQGADQAGIGNARYNTPLEVLDHPNLVDRNRWSEIDSPVGPLASALPPPVIVGYQPRLGSVPELGEHTEAVLAELGLSAAETDRLREAGVVGTPPRPGTRLVGLHQHRRRPQPGDLVHQHIQLDIRVLLHEHHLRDLGHHPPQHRRRHERVQTRIRQPLSLQPLDRPRQALPEITLPRRPHPVHLRIVPADLLDHLHDPRLRPVRLQIRAVPPRDPLHRVVRRVMQRLRRQQAHLLLRRHLPENLLLRLEVMVERPVRRPRRARDITDPRVQEPIPLEDRLGRLQQPQPRPRPLRRPRARSRRIRPLTSGVRFHVRHVSPFSRRATHDNAGPIARHQITILAAASQPRSAEHTVTIIKIDVEIKHGSYPQPLFSVLRTGTG